MKTPKAKDVALSGMLFALAIALSLMESGLTPFLGLLPGVKIGLANIVVMYALFFLGRRQALLLVVLKAFFSLIFFGVTAGFLSLCGGLLSLGVMAVLGLFHASRFVQSVSGALGHNIGQLLGASVVLSNALTLAYLPVLLVSGVVMGSITALSLKLLSPALERVRGKGGR